MVNVQKSQANGVECTYKKKRKITRELCHHSVSYLDKICELNDDKRDTPAVEDGRHEETISTCCVLFLPFHVCLQFPTPQRTYLHKIN